MIAEHSFLEIISGAGKYCNERLLNESLHHNRYAPVNDLKEKSGYGTMSIMGSLGPSKARVACQERNPILQGIYCRYDNPMIA
jgi:hypothetical protein